MDISRQFKKFQETSQRPKERSARQPHGDSGNRLVRQSAPHEELNHRSKNRENGD